jgi:hypothetical protein
MLIDHPNVTLDDQIQTPLRIREIPVEVRLESQGEVFKPAVYQADASIDAIHEQPTLFLGNINNRESLLLRMDKERRVLWMSTLDQRILRLINDLSTAERREAVLDREAAEHFADLIVHVAQPRRLEVQLPESLAGPEQPLEPKIELHLSPRGKEGMQVGLRVACDAVADQPIPGMEPERLRIATAAGRFQLLRALDEEASRADEIADQLQLHLLAFDSQYTWLASSPDEALELLQRIEQLGESAPTVCWPKSQPMQVIGEITPHRLQVKLTSGRDWFGLDGYATLEGLEIPLAELLTALRQGRRFVPLGDGQFALISETLRQRLGAIQDVSIGDPGQIRVSKAGTAVIEEALGSDISVEADMSWKDALARLASAKNLQPVVPSTLQADLREYHTAG